MTIKKNKACYFAVVPAAGIGQRMAADCPKQYLTLDGKTIFEHTIEKLLAVDSIEKIIITVSEHDDRWRSIELLNSERIEITAGGAQRADSVLKGLRYLQTVCSDDDWVLVHDVARPCVDQQDILHLIETLESNSVGGLLAIPLSDTVKRVNDRGLVAETLDRNRLWRAQTPQMFRFRLLFDALQHGISAGEMMTDEAAAIELAGLSPVVVEGSSDNIKITRPEDLALAEFFLKQAELQSKQ